MLPKSVLKVLSSFEQEVVKVEGCVREFRDLIGLPSFLAWIVDVIVTVQHDVSAAAFR